MANDKISCDREREASHPHIHRLIARMPEFQRKYGLWIINATTALSTPVSGFKDCPERKFEFYSISHLIEGGGILWLDGLGEVKLSPGTLVVITPNTLNRYGGDGKLPYVEDAIRFCGPIADMLVNAGLLTSGAYELGRIRRLPPIAELLENPSVNAQFQANLLLQNLLADVFFKNREHQCNSKMEELLKVIKSDLHHWWTVEELAELSSLSIESLRRHFFAHTGMLPKAYLEEFKLRKAAEQLLSTELSVQKIASLLGYRDPYHFSRRFKLQMGSAPELYRKQFRREISSDKEI